MTRTPNSFRQSLQNLVDVLATSEIALDTNPAVVLTEQGLKRVTWPPTVPVGEVFRAPAFTIGVYRDLIAARAFTVLLRDGSLLQMSFDFAGNVVVGHRLAFVPSPFDFEPDLLFDLPLLDVLDEYSQDLDHVRLRSPIRFDFDAINAAAEHAAVHATIVSPACRWPVVAPLSVGHFVRFVFHRFYPSLWNAHAFLREMPCDVLSARTITTDEESELHISWREILE